MRSRAHLKSSHVKQADCENMFLQAPTEHGLGASTPPQILGPGKQGPSTCTTPEFTAKIDLLKITYAFVDQVLDSHHCRKADLGENNL